RGDEPRGRRLADGEQYGSWARGNKWACGPETEFRWADYIDHDRRIDTVAHFRSASCSVRGFLRSASSNNVFRCAAYCTSTPCNNLSSIKRNCLTKKASVGRLAFLFFGRAVRGWRCARVAPPDALWLVLPRPAWR